MKIIRNRRALLLAALVAAIPVLACGPWFPNRLLDGGDAAVLVAPYADFSRELVRMQLVTTKYLAKPRVSDQSYAEQSIKADLADLRVAFRKAGVDPQVRSDIFKRYEQERKKVRPNAHSEEDTTDQAGTSGNPAESTGTPQKSEAIIPAGLPREFTDYFRGAIAWAEGDTNSAIAAWEVLLQRPAKDRPFKSTWAAFMLGKAVRETNPDQARDYFRQVRSLVQDGFSDSLGLAVASLGWEAKTHYDE